MKKTTLFCKALMLVVLLCVGSQASAQGFLNKLKKATDKVTETVSSATGSSDAAADTATVKVQWDKLPEYKAELVYLLDSISGDTLRNEDGTAQFRVVLRDQFGNLRTPATVKAQQKIVNDAVASILIKVGSGALIGGLTKGGKGAAIGAGAGAVASAGDIAQATKWKKVLKQQEKLLEAYNENFTEEGKPKDASMDPTQIGDLSLDKTQAKSQPANTVMAEMENAKEYESNPNAWEL